MMLLVIGYGNPLRRDDGVGPWLVEYLAGSIHDPSIKWMTCHQLTPELAELLSHADAVIFVDSSVVGRPGQISCCRREARDVFGARAFIHHLTPEGLLATAHSLYAYVPEAFILTMTGDDFGYGQGFSPSVQSQLPAAIEYLSAAISPPALLHFSPE